MTPHHGTRPSYNTGCRCEPCTFANREYVRRYNARRLAAGWRLTQGHWVRPAQEQAVSR